MMYPYHSTGRDVQYMNRAYASDSGVVYDESRRTVYVAGTKSPADVIADLTLVPLSATRNTQRYALIQQYVAQGATKLEGHSLGSAVVGQWMADNPSSPVRARLFDWPSVHLGDSPPDPRIVDTTRWGDPVTVTDLTAHRSFGVPHTYT